MRTTMNPRLGSLSQAFDRVGQAFVSGWSGDERAVASLGQRSKAPLSVWVRAREAISILQELVRDGRLMIIAYDGKGGRWRYFEDVREEMSALLLPPDPTACGLIELRSGTTMSCEVDLFGLPAISARSGKVGRKPKYPRFEELIIEGLSDFGPVASNADLKDHARARIGDQPYPENRSTQNDIIDRVRCSGKPH